MLYEVYNELHGLARELETPFDALAMLVVGHQTYGKSALVEALMDFQFNHVGRGTKTRRPITLHMTPTPPSPGAWPFPRSSTVSLVDVHYQPLAFEVANWKSWERE
ncbi:hypothetical protein B296_00001299 [Ensete ventricosum]|uniref:Dynamin-type G domain-containing protein n=1 Tax=Ensete ventricosum TaxID=4639 RepID=A0A427AJS6_ENSVE|nr:hypothetical protein B296_00001299 [Ensete ventricosum]